PSAHIDVAIGRAGTSRVHRETDTGLAFAAIAATSAGNVEGNGDDVALFQELDVVTHLDDFARDFVSENQTLGGRGAAAHHVLVRAADVGGDHAQDYAMRCVLAAERICFTLGHSQFGVGDGLNLHLSRLDVRNTAIRRCHKTSPFYLY